MRNLLKYPVTNKEIVDYLRKASQRELDEERCGDMGPTLLDCAAIIVEREAKITDSLLDIVDAVRTSAEDVPLHILNMILASIPTSDELGCPKG